MAKESPMTGKKIAEKMLDPKTSDLGDVGVALVAASKKKLGVK